MGRLERAVWFGGKKIALIPPSHGKLTQNIKKKDHPQSREIKICVVIADREVSCMVPRKKKRELVAVWMVSLVASLSGADAGTPTITRSRVEHPALFFCADFLNPLTLYVST